MRKYKTPIRLSLFLMLAWLASACQHSIVYRYVTSSTFTLTIKERQAGNEAVEEALFQSLYQKINSRGYTYAAGGEQTPNILVLDYQYQLAQANKLTLTASLSLYDPVTKVTQWTQSASASALRMDNLDKLVEQVSRALASRLPYAPDFGGTGIVLGRDLKIVNFIENSPAQKAGLKKNDRIVKIDEETDLDYHRCQQLLQGQSGSKVNLTVLRNGEQLSFKVVRASVESLGSAETQPVKIEPLAIDQLKKKLATP